ncbi:regulatory protein RecX [Leucobacter sp. M11]|uniref:regulatory protein RecX n=1 Tax=Leucobacter sp. M11 TaxID=2993565 RepID=UPI002D810F19|nr:regulatory protein RecX [Leucobacter sp. M11]MEB4615899.1 regulatory protein RecX [Leucobacter sp. M11]
MVVRFLPVGGPERKAPVPPRDNLAEVVELRSRLVPEETPDAEPAPDLGDPREQAMRRLARSAQSVTEIERFLRGKGHQPEAIEPVVREFLDRGYLDDLALAKAQTGILRERKRMSTRIIERTLNERGIPREFIGIALAEFDPEGDDEDRVLREAARDRARKMGSLDRATAERRLIAFLARRGFGGSSVRDIAREALDEAAR